MLHALLTKHQRFFRFAVVGVVCTLIDFGIFFSLHHLGMGIILANILAYSAGIVVNFLLNRYWTFADSEHKQMQRLGIALIWGYCGLMLSTGLVWMLAQVLPLLAAKIITVLVMLFVNYTANQLIIFRTKP
jgi:putative flippase GtrA